MPKDHVGNEQDGTEIPKKKVKLKEVNDDWINMHLRIKKYLIDELIALTDKPELSRNNLVVDAIRDKINNLRSKNGI